jgi:hypothetical protein
MKPSFLDVRPEDGRDILCGLTVPPWRGSHRVVFVEGAWAPTA